MYAGILAMGLLGVALYFIIQGFEMHVSRHRSREDT
jgi:hypothetical protein